MAGFAMQNENVQVPNPFDRIIARAKRGDISMEEQERGFLSAQVWIVTQEPGPQLHPIHVLRDDIPLLVVVTNESEMRRNLHLHHSKYACVTTGRGVVRSLAVGWGISINANSDSALVILPERVEILRVLAQRVPQPGPGGRGNENQP